MQMLKAWWNCTKTRLNLSIQQRAHAVRWPATAVQQQCGDCRESERASERACKMQIKTFKMQIKTCKMLQCWKNGEIRLILIILTNVAPRTTRTRTTKQMVDPRCTYVHAGKKLIKFWIFSCKQIKYGHLYNNLANPLCTVCAFPYSLLFFFFF
jgi:hypothetical protein